MKFSEISEKEFAKFIDKCKTTSFLQSVEMYHRYKARGSEAYLLGLFDDKKLAAATLVFSRRQVLRQKIFEAPDGFLMDYDNDNFAEIFREFSRSIKNFLRAKGGAALQINPNYRHTVATDEHGKILSRDLESGDRIKKVLSKAGYKDLGEFEFSKWIYILTTKGLELDGYKKSLRTTHRQMIDYATKRYASRVRELSIDEIDELLELIHEAAERHGFTETDRSYYEQMGQVFSGKKFNNFKNVPRLRFMVAETPKAVILADEKDGLAAAKAKAAEIDSMNEKERSALLYVPTAGAMFVEYGNEVTYLFSGSSDKYRKYCGSYLIQWEEIKNVVEQGYDTYNFYGVMPDPKNGVYKFKLGFKGDLAEKLGTFILPLNAFGKIYIKKFKYHDFSEVH